MRTQFLGSRIWPVGLLLVVLGGNVFATSPFVNSRSQPHGVLYLNYKMVPRQVYPVRVWMVDGKLTNRSNQMVVWMKPGDYKLTIKLTKVVNLAYVPGLKQQLPNQPQMRDLRLDVQAGKAYYIGAKFDNAGAWQPVVWNTEDLK